MSAHTPGRDWIAKDLHVNSGSEGFAIMQRHAHGTRRVDDGRGAFSEPDARLIAAAPELLEALTRLFKFETRTVDFYASREQVVAEARVAIAKATLNA